jgi:WD40 repeat protein
MKQYGVAILVVFGTFCAISTFTFADAKVEVHVVAPAQQNATYIVSPESKRLATVTMKGSRHVVLIDNEEGPLFDQMLQVNGQPFYRPGGPIDTRGHLPAVVFSSDAKRFAYCGRVGEEAIIVLDGKEFARVPHTATGFRYGPLRFSPGGKHFYYARSDDNVRVVINGQAGPPLAVLAGPVFVIAFSPDDSRWAYAAVPGNKRGETMLIVDGKEAKYVEGPVVHEQLAFLNDGRFVCVAKAASGATLLVDGKPAVTAKEIRRVFLAPQGNSLAAIIVKETYPVLWLDGKEITDTLGVDDFVFSPDGKRYAAYCKRPGSNSPQWIVSDGKKHQEYQGIRDNRDVSGRKHIQFTSDSSKLVYTVTSGGLHFVVINGEEMEPGFMEGQPYVTLSETGGRVAFAGRAANDAPTQRTVIVDGKKQQVSQQFVYNSVTFSPDGSRYYFRVWATGPDKLIVDGDELAGFTVGRVTAQANVHFSPDNQYLAFVGTKLDGRQNGLFINGQLVQAQDGGYHYRAFTPDSRHFYWLKHTRADKYVWHLDGKPTVELDRHIVGQLDMIRDTVHMDDDGVLTLIAYDGDVLKRYRITPSDETSVAAMLAAAEQPVAAAPATEAVAAGFDGAWSSAQHRYGFRIEGQTGKATHTNTRAYAVGGVILRIESVSGNTFRAQHMFRDGKWNAVTGELVNAKTLRLAGGGARWDMTRASD